MTVGYQALKQGAAFLDLSGRGKIKATGEDRIRLLHAMTTNHVEQLGLGDGCYAFFLNAQGRILADVNLFRLADHLLLDTEPETREKVFQHLDRFIIADDVTLTDVTGETATVGIEGPRAGEILKAAGAPLPEADQAIVAWGDRLIAHTDATGAGGYRVFLPAADREALFQELRTAGAVEATAGDAREVRIENGRPRYGEDLTEDYIPHETQLMGAIHFSKGCYLGQEIVERVRSRGQVNKKLVRLRLEGGNAPEPGAKLMAGDKEVGVITSAVLSPASGNVAAMGYVRTQHAEIGEKLSIEGGSAEVVASGPN
jgi:folate-binding protein YgfZ